MVTLTVGVAAFVVGLLFGALVLALCAAARSQRE